MEWIPTTQAFPKSGDRVLFSMINSQGRRRTSIGYYSGKLSLRAEEQWEGFNDLDADYFDYSPDDTDCQEPYIPEGWFEEGAEGEYCYSQSGVTHWMPLPKSPEEE
jgi:hypothetical protein